MGLLPLACLDCGFESRPGYGFVSCDCCVLSGRGLCDGLITRPECVVPECDRETSIMNMTWPNRGWCAVEGDGVERLLMDCLSDIHFL